MNEKLHVEFNEAEKAASTSVALTFSVASDGSVRITEHWADKSELWGDGCSISIPARVWAMAAPWLKERS